MSYYNPIDYSNVQQYNLTTNHHIEMASPSSQNSPGIGSGGGVGGAAASASAAANSSATTSSSKASGSDTTSQVSLYFQNKRISI